MMTSLIVQIFYF